MITKPPAAAIFVVQKRIPTSRIFFTKVGNNAKKNHICESITLHI